MGSKLEGDKNRRLLHLFVEESSERADGLGVRTDTQDKILEALGILDEGVDEKTVKDKIFNTLRNSEEKKPITAEEAERIINLRTALKAIKRNRGEEDELAPTSLTTYPAYGSEENNVAG